MNLGEMRTKLSWLLNFNSGQTDQDFGGSSVDTNRDLDWSLNEAYREEVKYARRMIRREAFTQAYDLTWPADGESLDIPNALKNAEILGIRDDTDLTDGNPGTFLVFRSQFAGNVDSIYVIDRDTWGWYPAPSSAKTLKVFHLASPPEMTQATDEPELLPEDDHDLLVWSAGILLRTVADEVAPPAWSRRQQDLRESFWKGVAMGRPMIQPPPHIRHTDPHR